MKIAMLGQKGIPAVFGGIERHVEELSKRLAAEGHEVLVYSRPWYCENREQRKEKRVDTLHTILMPTVKMKNLDAIVHTFISTVHAMLFVKPDIYHYHGVGPALLSWMPRVFSPRSKVIVTFHCIDRKHQKWGLPARLALRAGEWASCRFAHETITVSRTLEQYCQDVYETKTHYIPNGISEVPTVGSTLIKRFSLEPNKYIAMVSRLVRHKGAHYLIAAWNQLQIEEPELTRDLKLAIIGDGAFTDDYVRELKMLAGADPSIVFTGFQSGAMLDELFANALFVAHPSESEGLPIAVLEAMSYGKVVLASDIPENMEVVADHGFHFKNTDINDLQSKIIELVNSAPHLSKVGERAREFVLREYHWDDIAKKVDELYQKCRNEQSSPSLQAPKESLRDPTG